MSQLYLAMKLLNCYECSRGFQNRKDEYTDCGFCTRLQQEQRDRKYANRTELAKHIWKLKDNNENYKISWYIISSASAYNNISKRCNLCLTEKLYIIKANKASNLNKRAELISKCRHENKYSLVYIDTRLQLNY